MKIHDVSLALSPDLTVWPGDPQIELQRYMHIAQGDAANVSRLSCCVHAGTHVDAPAHFVEGAATVEQLPLDVLIGPAVVVELPDLEAITAGHLEALALAPATTRLLFKTRNSALWADATHTFRPDYVALTTEAATWLAQRGIRLVGIDYLSVQRFDDAEPLTHRVLLGAGVVVVEGLDLRQVSPGVYRLVCLPVKLVGSDGAPARAVLIEE